MASMRAITLLAGFSLVGCFTPGNMGDGSDEGSTSGSSADGPTSETNPSTGTSAGPTGPTTMTTATTAPSTTSDETGTTTGEDGSTEESTGAGAVCPETHTCVPEAPPDWTGPVIFYEGTDASPDCPGDYPGLEIDANDGLSAGAPTCGCDCDGTQNCGRVTIQHLGACTFPAILYATDWVNVPDTCVSLQQPADATSINVGMFEEAQSGSCDPIASENIPPTSWSTNARICGGAFLPEGCGGGEVCSPLPPPEFDGAVCVYREGVSGCPLDFPVQHTYFTDLDDTRDCSTCTCGALQGVVECGATIRLSSSASCSTQAVADFAIEAPVCQPKLATMNYARVTDLELTQGGCTPSGGVAQGQATPAGDVTVCCTS